jgi:hypothetical protein
LLNQGGIEMEQLFEELSKINFASLCDEIKYESGKSLIFIPKQGFHKNSNVEVYEIKETTMGLIVTDNGNTYSNLDDVFELSEIDVIKNIDAILQKTNIKWYGKEFISIININEKLYPQLLLYLQGINILYSMKIFYV